MVMFNALATVEAWRAQHLVEMNMQVQKIIIYMVCILPDFPVDSHI